MADGGGNVDENRGLWVMPGSQVDLLGDTTLFLEFLGAITIFGLKQIPIQKPTVKEEALLIDFTQLDFPMKGAPPTPALTFYLIHQCLLCDNSDPQTWDGRQNEDRSQRQLAKPLHRPTHCQ